MRVLFSVAEIAALTGGRLLQGSPDTPVTGFAYDNRMVKPGDCFVAMPGAKVDGHRFAGAAAAAGAACLLVGRPVDLGPEAGSGGGVAVVQVPDPLIALGMLGRERRRRFPIPAVGITGSVGKTTTKELVAATLGSRFAVFRTPGNLNSEVGLPVALMALDQEHEVAVLEMGMRALGELTYLVSIAAPQIGIVTNVGTSHLEKLGTQANIALAKSELIRGLPAGGVAILNADDPRVAAMAAVAPAGGRVWRYGYSLTPTPGELAVTVRNLRSEGEAGQRFELVTPAGTAEAFLPAPGRHNVLNAMAAVAAGLELGMSLTEAAAGLAAYAPSGSRMRIVHAGGVRILDDTYNAAPVSVVAALGVMRDLAGPQGRCIAVLGDMYELGEATAAGHRQVGREAGRLADLVLAVGGLTGPIAAEAAGKAEHFAAKPAAIDRLLSLVRAGDTVLLKGSRGMALEEMVAALEAHLAGQ